MINKKTFFCLIISLIALGNAETQAMIPHTNAFSTKTTSFFMFYKLISNYFMRNKEEVVTTIEHTKNELLDEVAALKNANQIQEQIHIANPDALNKYVTNITNLWNHLSCLYVSNRTEEFFNPYGPDIENGYSDDTSDEINKQINLPSIVKAIKLRIHPDKNRHNTNVFTELSKTLTIERRQDKIFLQNVSNNLNELAEIIKNEHESAVTMVFHKELTNRTDEVLKLKKSALQINSESMIQKNKMAQRFK